MGDTSDDNNEFLRIFRNPSPQRRWSDTKKHDWFAWLGFEEN